MMTRILRILPLVLMIVGIALVLERPAYAYADPGSGLLAIQAAGSALVATGWYLRRKLYALFHRGAAKQQPQDSSPLLDGQDPPPASE